MTAHAILKRGFVALCCLAAAGCARVVDEQGRELTSTTEVAAEAATSPAAETVATPKPPPEAPIAIAAPPRRSIEELAPAPPAEVQPPQASSADATSTPAPPAPQSAAPLPADADGESEVFPSATATPAAAETLDFTSLMTRLRKTKAINLRTKLAVKNESDDLLEQFRAYHARRDAATLAELRRSYDSLFRKVYSLLQDADPPLALEIDRSHGVIWEILKNPTTFRAALQRGSSPISPRA
jgi:hypothetical protein